MQIGQQIKRLRGQKGMSQGDIGQSANLMRNYLSRVENGHTVPSLQTLERIAIALDVPLYMLFLENETPEPGNWRRKPDGRQKKKRSKRSSKKKRSAGVRAAAPAKGSRKN